MKKQYCIYTKNISTRRGVTLVELLVTMAISLILTMSVGALLVGGQRSWQQGYENANSKTKQDAQAVMIAFGGVGRKSNRLNYTIYYKTGSTFTPSVPQTGVAEQIVYGDAVEFRFWSAAVPTAEMLDFSQTGTDYALFYIENSKLYVDYGKVPLGAVPGGSGSKNTSQIQTIELAENVTPDPNGAFSHNTISGLGQGCVRINVVLGDPCEPQNKINVKTATLMRNIWPR